MLKKIGVLAMLLAVGVVAQQASAANPPTTTQNAATRPTARRSYSAPPTLPWPAYANYGNQIGKSYSKAAGLREGQVFGTFGSARPADARARGGY